MGRCLGGPALLGITGLDHMSVFRSYEIDRLDGNVLEKCIAHATKPILDTQNHPNVYLRVLSYPGFYLQQEES